MTLRIVWRQSAREDLAAIIRFVAERNPYAARELKVRIQSAVLPMAEHPYMGREGRISGTREWLAHPNYWVIYEVGLDRIEIAAVIHARSEYP